MATLHDTKVRPDFWVSVTDWAAFAEPVAASFDGPKRESLLWLAAERNCPEIARLLAAHGAKPGTEGSNGDTALMNAADKGNAQLVKILIEAGANVNSRSGNGASTPLISASSGFASAQHGEGAYADTVRLLIDAGANVNGPNASGLTPLHCAHNPNVSLVLSKAGAK